MEDVLLFRCPGGGLGPMRAKALVGFWERLRGLTPRDAPESVLIERCRCVHTLGMRSSLDVAFLSGDGVALRVLRNQGPGRLLRCHYAWAVLERRAMPGRWIEPGERWVTVVPAEGTQVA